MATSASIEFLKKTTEELIDIEPTLVTLTHPPAMISNGRGGLIAEGSSTVESPGKKRFFSQTTPKEQVVVRSEGKEIIVDWVLIGLVGDDIREGDTFTVSGVLYKVWNVHEDKRWQTKGLVARA